jgi:hypothetical protein
MFNNFFFRKSGHLWNNVDKYSTRRQGTDANVVHTHCTLDKHTLSEYVMLTVFPQQQCLQERASVLRFTYFSCLVNKFWE